MLQLDMESNVKIQQTSKGMCQGKSIPEPLVFLQFLQWQTMAFGFSS